MSEQITRYAIEYENLGGRSFVLTSFPLESGGRYDGPLLFDTEQSATLSMLEDADEDDLDTITQLAIRQDGSISDAFGFSVLENIARQTGLSEAELKSSLAAYYEQENGCQVDQVPEAPGF